MKKIERTLIPFVSVLLVLILIAAGALRWLDRWAQDALYQRRSLPSSDLVIIGIDDRTLDTLGPWPDGSSTGQDYRTYMGIALSVLASDPEHMPAAVAVDVLYEGSGARASSDRMLAAAAQRLGCAVTAVAVEYGDIITWDENGHATSRRVGAVNTVLPFDALRESSVQGHINIMPDTDGVLRHALLTVTAADGQTYPSMAAQAARLYAERHGRELKLPDTGTGHFYVPFTGRPGDFSDGYSLVQLIDPQYWPDGSGEEARWQPISPEAWADKIVLIGPYAAGLQDAYFTSMSRAVPMYGVEYQANVIQSLIEGNVKTEVGDGVQLAAVAVILCAASWFLFRSRFQVSGAICAGLIALGFTAPLLLYRVGLVVHVLWLPVGTLVLFLLAMGWHYFEAARERRALALEKQRIDTELSLATRIQANSLPKRLPERPSFDLSASMTPAREVGGDLYDFFFMDDDHLCLVIGDVSGKGVPASLFMMLTSTLIHYVAGRERSPAKILTAVNAEICSRNPEEMFITVWLGVLELSTGILTAANAGHEYPALRRPDGSFELFKDRHGFVIGGMEGVRYREYTLQLSPGTKLFVYTDGVPEATDAREEMFGTDRMLDALRAHEQEAPEAILAGVSGAVSAFVGAAPQFDDLTMLCLAWNGSEPAG